MACISSSEDWKGRFSFILPTGPGQGWEIGAQGRRVSEEEADSRQIYH